MLAHTDALRWLGLEVGTVNRYSFTASYTDHDSGGPRTEQWSCQFQERVVSASDVDANGLLWTVVEIQRTIDRDACRRATEDWGLTPHDGREFLVIGGDATAYDVQTRLPRSRGIAVYRQTNRLALGHLDEAPLEYVLPISAGTLWPHEPEGRSSGEVSETLSRRVEQRVAKVTTPAGTFHECWMIDTWASANTNDTSWVCGGVGEVRRSLKRFAGSLHLTAQRLLVERAHQTEAGD